MEEKSADHKCFEFWELLRQISYRKEVVHRARKSLRVTLVLSSLMTVVLLCVCRVPVQIAGRALGWSLRLRLGSWVFTLLGYHPIQFSHCFEGTVVPPQSSLGPLGTLLPHTPNPWPFSFGGRGHRGGRYVSATRVNTPGDKWEKENPGTSVPMAKFLA